MKYLPMNKIGAIKPAPFISESNKPMIQAKAKTSITQKNLDGKSG